MITESEQAAIDKWLIPEEEIKNYIPTEWSEFDVGRITKSAHTIISEINNKQIDNYLVLEGIRELFNGLYIIDLEIEDLTNRKISRSVNKAAIKSLSNYLHTSSYGTKIKEVAHCGPERGIYQIIVSPPARPLPEDL